MWPQSSSNTNPYATPVPTPTSSWPQSTTPSAQPAPYQAPAQSAWPQSITPSAQPAPYGGSVQGASTSSGGGGFDMSQYAGWGEPEARADFAATGGPPDPYVAAEQARLAAEERVRGDITSGYDAYFKTLDEQMASLGTQQTAREGIVGSQYTQGQSDLALQEQQGLGALQTQEDKAMTNQEKNLKNLTENTRNSMMAGNIYLGSRGAGDSSAANQYSYALTKLGTKARGGVMSQTSDIVAEIGKRETDLRATVDNEERRLASDRDIKLGEVADWFTSAQQQVRQAQASGQLQKGTDLANLSRSLLDQAMAKLSQIDQEASSRRQALDQWAITNSNSIAEVKANLQRVSGFNPSLPQAGPIASTPQVDTSGNLRVFGGSANPEEERGLFA